MALTGAVPLTTTTRPPLVIRAPLSTNDDTDSDISPVYSETSLNSFHSASDEETITVASGSTLDTSTGFLARIPSMPVAKITGDDEMESGDEEEAEKDEFFGVAKVADLIMGSKDEFFDAIGENGFEKRTLEVGESSNKLEIPVTPFGLQDEPVGTTNSSSDANEDNFGTDSNQTYLNQKTEPDFIEDISDGNYEDSHEQEGEDSNQEVGISEPIVTELQQGEDLSQEIKISEPIMTDFHQGEDSNEEINISEPIITELEQGDYSNQEINISEPIVTELQQGEDSNREIKISEPIVTEFQQGEDSNREIKISKPILAEFQQGEDSNQEIKISESIVTEFQQGKDSNREIKISEPILTEFQQGEDSNQEIKICEPIVTEFQQGEDSNREIKISEPIVTEFQQGEDSNREIKISEPILTEFQQGEDSNQEIKISEPILTEFQQGEDSNRKIKISEPILTEFQQGEDSNQEIKISEPIVTEFQQGEDSNREIKFSEPTITESQQGEDSNQEINNGLIEEVSNLPSIMNTEPGSSDLGENLQNHEEIDDFIQNSNEEVGENGLSDVESSNYKGTFEAKDTETEPELSIQTNQDKGKELISDEALDGDSSISSAFSNSNLDFENENSNEIEAEKDEEEKFEFNPSSLASYIREQTGSTSEDIITIAYKQDGPKLVSVDRAPPTGLPSLSVHHAPKPQIQDDVSSGFDPDFLSFLNENEKKIHEKVDLIRVNFIRLVYKLGLTLDEKIASEVLSRLTLAEGLKFKMPFNEGLILENAKSKALKLDNEGKSLNFKFKILVLGKIGVGKSALINSIFKNEKSRTDPFSTGTNQIEEIVGQVDGVTLHIVDTPGLQTSVMDQALNRKLLSSLKKLIKKSSFDTILYVDRVDTQNRNFNDLPVLRSITNILGQSVWSKVVKVLTHASSAPPEGPSGSQLDYQMYVTQRAHGIQQAIRMTTRDSATLNPVALVENHILCRKNCRGEMVLPNGLTWRPNLLLLCYSMKILSQANSLLNLNPNNNVNNNGGVFGAVSRPLPLKYLISYILESRDHLKLTNGDVEFEDKSEIFIDLDLKRGNEMDEFDILPPFKPLKKSQIEKLTKEQKKAYFEEYEYRVKLFEKKQLIEAMRSLKEAEKSTESSELGGRGDEVASSSVPVTEIDLPLSFDSDSPLYRYRSLSSSETGYRVNSRPLLDPLGWDHDCGYYGVSMDQTLAILNQFPVSTRLQLRKDKDEFSMHLDSSVCVRHTDVASTLTTFEIRPVGRHLAYILNGETKFKPSKRNLTTGGVSVIFLGGKMAPCWKVEDIVRISNRASLTGSAGAVYSKDGGILGCNLEGSIRDGGLLGVSLIKLKDEVSLGTNLEMNFEVGSGSNLGVNFGLSSKGSGQIGMKISSCENVQFAILGLISIGVALFNKIRSGGGESEEFWG